MSRHLRRDIYVSRGPVRDALLHLTVEGLLEFKPNCGAVIRRSPEDAVQPMIVALRLQIEEYVLKNYFTEIQDRIVEIGKILDDMKKACSKKREQDLSKYDMAFHRAIVESSGSPDVISLWQTVASRMILHYSRLAKIEDSYAEHMAIFKAIKKGDSKEAIRQLKTNIK